jgi:hypothetical protein
MPLNKQNSSLLKARFSPLRCFSTNIWEPRSDVVVLETTEVLIIALAVRFHLLSFAWEGDHETCAWKSDTFPWPWLTCPSKLILKANNEARTATIRIFLRWQVCLHICVGCRLGCHFLLWYLVCCILRCYYSAMVPLSDAPHSGGDMGADSWQGFFFWLLRSIITSDRRERRAGSHVPHSTTAPASGHQIQINSSWPLSSSFNVARLDRELEIKAEEAMVETN